MNFLEFPITQSLIRTFLHNGEEREYCYRKIYLTKIAKTIKTERTAPMLSGSYFETQCLGKSSGPAINDLPRKKLTKKMIAENSVRKIRGEPLIKGEKYLDHLRIDDQIHRFKALIKKHQIIISNLNVQVPIYTKWDKDESVMLKAELDIFPTTILIDGELNAAIIDLKLTADIHSEYGEYCYGKPEYLDLIQAKMYHYVIRNIDPKLNPALSELVSGSIQNLIKDNRVLFLLWIFNYKKNVLEDKFIQVKWDGNKEAELNESIRKTIGILEMGEKEQWPTNPTYELCKKCPWTKCPDKIKMQTI